VSVRVDGVGGADPDGSGLTSPPGRGTSVDVRLPVAAR
jgi:hypothetical protein